MKVFLGGTVNGSLWRNSLIEMLHVDYFNPVVDDWNESAYQQELYEREHCDFCLYVITPMMEGFYSLAEVVDDSFKKADKTIYCYLEQDGGKQFSEKQLHELRQIGALVQSNGAIWKNSLQSIADFLNSAQELANDHLLQNANENYDIFISYGRRHSLAFAHRLYQVLTKRGFKVWFDMNDIPLGVDFQQQIDDGISRSDNILFILSPHAIHSEYCGKELELALKYKKRIIPVLHVEPQDDATWEQIHPELARRNWAYFRQDHDTALALSEEAYDKKDAIANITDPYTWKMIDDFDGAFSQLSALIDSHRSFVRTHTVLLDKALDWEQGKCTTSLLLTGLEREIAEQWLQRSQESFKNPTGHLIQPPCSPTDLMARFIMESRKNGKNMQSDIFICHDSNDWERVNAVVQGLHRYGFSTWVHDHDITKGSTYEEAVLNGVEQSATMLLFISKNAITSKYCQKEYQYALSLNKRIVPIELEEEVPSNGSFPQLNQLQRLDFAHIPDIHEHSASTTAKALRKIHTHTNIESRHSKTPFDLAMDELVQTLEIDRDYHEQHRVLLVQSLRWNRQAGQPSLLLRGFNLENAQTWLRIHEKRTSYPPTQVQKDFIHASDAAKGQLSTEAFISYSRKDGDFARHLNTQLQLQGHTTWFDQESISKGVDFEKEIFKGIDGCNNFIFIISPDAILSEYCEREVSYATQQGKRIITLLWRETDEKQIPKYLRKINWIDFRKGKSNEAFTELIGEIEMDREHAHGHTTWQQRATEWRDSGMSTDYLLNESAFHNAELWLKNAAGKRPVPTKLQTDYLKASKKAIVAAEKEALDIQLSLKKRLQYTQVAVALAILLAIMAAVFFYRAQNTNEELKKSKQSIEEANIRLQTSSESITAQLNRVKEANKQIVNLVLKDTHAKRDNMKYDDAVKTLKEQSEYVKTLKKQSEYIQSDTASLLLTNAFVEAYTEYIVYYALANKIKTANKLLEEAYLLAGKEQKLLTGDYKGIIPRLKPIIAELASDSLFELHCKRYLPEMVQVKGGIFELGSNTRRREYNKNDTTFMHPVKVDDFKIGRYEVTVAQYLLFCSATNKKIGWDITKQKKEGIHDKPIVKVSWYDAIAYCNYVSEVLDSSMVYTSIRNPKANWEAKGYRLPTEAEWEYAARGGHTQEDFYIYSGSNSIDTVAWYNQNTLLAKTKYQRVGLKRANTLGIHDMSGNLREWCWDLFESTYPQGYRDNPIGPSTSSSGASTANAARVLRGGCWKYNAERCSINSRGSGKPRSYYEDTGFRVATR